MKTLEIAIRQALIRKRGEELYNQTQNKEFKNTMQEVLKRTSKRLLDYGYKEISDNEISSGII